VIAVSATGRVSIAEVAETTVKPVKKVWLEVNTANKEKVQMPLRAYSNTKLPVGKRIISQLNKVPTLATENI